MQDTRIEWVVLHLGLVQLYNFVGRQGINPSKSEITYFHVTHQSTITEAGNDVTKI